MSQQLQTIIDQAWENRAEINPRNGAAELRDAVSHVINGLDNGSIRVAEKTSGDWVVNQWVKTGMRQPPEELAAFLERLRQIMERELSGPSVQTKD